MHHTTIQPKSLKKAQHQQKPKIQHVEIEHKKDNIELGNKEWIETIQKEIHQFEITIQQVDALFKEAEETETINTLGSFKLAKNEHAYVDGKAQHLRDLATTFQGLLTEEEKELDSQKKKLITHQLVKAREILQFQFSIAQRVLVLIQVYIKLKNQYSDQGELQKHRDYILSKIDKIKLSEEKHVKKLHKHLSRVVVDDDNDYEEEEEEQEIQEEEDHESARDELIKLCDNLISYLNTVEITEEDRLLHHDLATLQFFDQIKVGLPFHSKYVKRTIELIQARKTYYENAQESEFSEFAAQPEVKQQKQQQQLNIDSEQDFPKLS